MYELTKLAHECPASKISLTFLLLLVMQIFLNYLATTIATLARVAVTDVALALTLSKLIENALAQNWAKATYTAVPLRIYNSFSASSKGAFRMHNLAKQALSL